MTEVSPKNTFQPLRLHTWQLLGKMVTRKRCKAQKGKHAGLSGNTRHFALGELTVAHGEAIFPSKRTKALPATFPDDQSHSSSRPQSGPTNHVAAIAKLGEQNHVICTFPLRVGPLFRVCATKRETRERRKKKRKIIIILLFLSQHMFRVLHHKLE